MKRLFIFLLIIAICSPTFAQRKRSRKGSVIKWLSIGVKGGGGNTIMYNPNILNDSKLDVNYVSPSYFVGGRLGITIGDYVSLFGEACSAGYNSNYTLNEVGANSLSYDKELKLKSLDYAVTFRYTSLTGVYVELGPKFIRLKSAEETNTLVEETQIQPSFFSESGDYEPLDNYSQKLTTGIFGFGISPLRTDRLDLTLGLRFNFGFTDMFPDNKTPLNDGYYEYDADFDSSYNNPYTATHLFNAQVVMEFNYVFGFWGDAACGKTRLMLFK